MKQILSYTPMMFRVLSFTTSKFTDNTHGVDTHFFGRLRKGSGTLTTLSGEILKLNAGDLFYIPLGLRYRSDWKPDSEGKLEWESYAFSSFPPSVDKQYLLQSFTLSPDASGYLDRIAYGSSERPEAIGYFYLFMDAALAVMKERHPDSARALLDKAKSYITQNPNFKVGELARACNMSESGLFALFQKQGLTPIELKHRVLVEKAVTLLSSTDLSVTEISDRLGFGDPGYFRKIFRRIIGKTPTEVRQERQRSIAL